MVDETILEIARNTVRLLEDEIADTERRIAQEEVTLPNLTEEHIAFWLYSLKKGDITDPAYVREVIKALIKGVHVYDDKIVVICNNGNDSGEECSSIAAKVDQTGVEPVSKSLFPVLLLS